MTTWAGIAAGGALGALARYQIDGLISRRVDSFPLGTLVINVSGCLLLGFLFTVLTERFQAAVWLRSALTIGFLGAYTTFSTYSLESFRLAEDGAWALAALNVGGSVAAGLLAVYVGVAAGRAV